MCTKILVLRKRKLTNHEKNFFPIEECKTRVTSEHQDVAYTSAFDTCNRKDGRRVKLQTLNVDHLTVSFIKTDFDCLGMCLFSKYVMHFCRYIL